jgi:subtilisin family serine protease
VILNAWGPNNVELTETITRAIDRVTTDGRQGRGCVVCFSAGNAGYVPLAEANSFAAYDKVLAIGASINVSPTNPCTSRHPDPDGRTTDLHAEMDRRAYYSPYGDELDLVAPSSTAETDKNVDPIVAATLVGNGTWISSRSVQTQLTRDAQANATNLEVANPQGFATHNILLVGLPGNAHLQFTTITAVAGNTVSVDPLRIAWPAGTPVSTGNKDYSRDFGGTSYAAAAVAGAAALVLSANRSLTWQEVRDILCTTADRIDPDQTNGDGRWIMRNGRPFSKWYGSGRLNVAAAVENARNLARPPDPVQLPPVHGGAVESRQR